MQDTKLNARCPLCTHALDCATSLVENVSPNPNDITICAYCAKPLAFNSNLSLRVATVSDLSNADKTQLKLAQEAVLFIIQENAKEATKM